MIAGSRYLCISNQRPTFGITLCLPYNKSVDLCDNKQGDIKNKTISENIRLASCNLFISEKLVLVLLIFAVVSLLWFWVLMFAFLLFFFF